MVRIESRRDGVLVVETYDLESGLYERTLDGVADVSRPMTHAEVAGVAEFESSRTVAANTEWVRAAAGAFVEANQAVVAAIDDPAGPVAGYLALPAHVEIDRPADATVASLANLNALKNWTVDRLNEVEARRAQDRAAVRWLFDHIGNSVLRQTTGIIRYLFGWLDSTDGAR